MTSKHIGAQSDADREFNARYRDKDGKLLWKKLSKDIVADPNRNPRSFAEIHAEMMERMKKRDEEERLKGNPSEDAA